MRLFLLGIPIAQHLNRWKDYIAEDAEDLGWDVIHVPAKDFPVEDLILEVKRFEPDIFMWSRTPGHNPAGNYEEMLRAIEDLGVITVSQHMDLYWGIPKRQSQIGIDPWWSAQYVFTADGGHQAEFTERGVNHYWMPPAIGHRVTTEIVPESKKWKGQVAFVGGFYSVAHGVHRQQLLVWAKKAYGDNFKRPHKIWGRDLSELYTSCDLVVGDSAPSSNGFYWSDRVVNTLGRGGLLAHNSIRGMNACGFTDDVMIKYQRFMFNDISDRYDEMSPAMRGSMRERGRTLVQEKHTYRNRLRQVQKVVGLG